MQQIQSHVADLFAAERAAGRVMPSFTRLVELWDADDSLPEADGGLLRSAWQIQQRHLPNGSLCVRCHEHEATVWWGDALAFTHGFSQPWCERCATEKQVEHARAQVAKLDELEARLQELGGPYQGPEPQPWSLPAPQPGTQTISE